MDESTHNEEDQRITRALNQAKERELEDKYGAWFSESDPDLPPDVYAEWLRHIEEFEMKSANARVMTLREFLGNPNFTPLGEVPAAGLKAELERVAECLAHHDIVVDCTAEVSDEDLYRFMTTELLDQEIEDIRIDGMQHHFIYEEFHPNAGEDAKTFAKHFPSRFTSDNIKETGPSEQ